MEGMGQNTENYKRDQYASTAEERQQKIKRPPAAVSILTGRTRSLSEAAYRGQRLRLWNQCSRMERLSMERGVIVV